MDRMQNIEYMQPQFQTDQKQWEDEITEMKKPNYGLEYSEEQEESGTTYYNIDEMKEALL